MELVLVPKAELDELRQLKADLPALLAKARAEGGMDRLKTLHDQQRADPAAYAEKARQRYHANKAEVLARRRELYRAKKVAAASKDAAKEES
jgi:hypothetical protein